MRGSLWNWSNPFVLGRPSLECFGADQERHERSRLWSRVVSNTKTQEVKVGFNNFQWANRAWRAGDTFQYSFPGLTLGKPYNYPQRLYQNNIESRYDLSWHKSKHDIKIGGEFIYAHITALWFLQQQGIMTFTSVPADITTRIPQSATMCRRGISRPFRLDRAAVRAELQPRRLDARRSRPTWSVWLGDTWRLNNQLTLNYGIRWDDNWNVATPPGWSRTRSRSTTDRRAARTSRMAGPTSATRKGCATTRTSPRARASRVTSTGRTTS